jgi:hypothetical protein
MILQPPTCSEALAALLGAASLLLLLLLTARGCCYVFKAPIQESIHVHGFDRGLFGLLLLLGLFRACPSAQGEIFRTGTQRLLK